MGLSKRTIFNRSISHYFFGLKTAKFQLIISKKNNLIFKFLTINFSKPIGSKNNPNRQTSNGPCDKPELVPNVKNGAYDLCESTKSKKRCDLKCDAGYAAVGSQKWVCKNGKDGAEIADEGGQCKKAPELPSPPGSCKPPSTWKETGSYSAGTHDAACDGDANGKKCFITYSLECKPG